MTIALAESCTGGWIAKCITDIAGSSAVLERGYVSYSNQSKQDLLGVSQAILETDGAVSERCALAMALGAQQGAGSDLALSVTGIAGPDGGTDEKPVGTVWMAWADRDGASARLLQFSGNRNAVREQTVIAALEKLLELLE